MGKKPNPDTAEPFGIGCGLEDLEEPSEPQIPVQFPSPDDDLEGEKDETAE